MNIALVDVDVAWLLRRIGGALAKLVRRLASISFLHSYSLKLEPPTLYIHTCPSITTATETRQTWTAPRADRHSHFPACLPLQHHDPAHTHQLHDWLPLRERRECVSLGQHTDPALVADVPLDLGSHRCCAPRHMMQVHSTKQGMNPEDRLVPQLEMADGVGTCKQI